MKDLVKTKIKMKNSANYEVAKFENEEGFTNGWYVLQVNTDDSHVIWQSEVFATEEEAKAEMEIQIKNDNA